MNKIDLAKKKKITHNDIPITKINGETIEDLAKKFGVEEEVIIQRLQDEGFDVKLDN